MEADLDPGFEAKAQNELDELERILKHPKPLSHRGTEHVAQSDVERTYTKFCVDNRLYLHPCPISSHEAYLDHLSVRFPGTTKDEYWEFRSNQLPLIKQEYIAARLLLFVYRSEMPDLFFVDRGAFLPSIGEDRGQIYLQLLNLSCRAAYAILDKIVYFLNTFFRLAQKPEGIHFREEFFLVNGALRLGLTKYDGLQLSALFDLAREFSKDQALYSLRVLRHKLEHRCVPVQRSRTSLRGNSPSDGRSGVTNADDLNENDLYEHAMLLLREVRASIFYLFYFVRISAEPPKSEEQAPIAYGDQPIDFLAPYGNGARAAV